MTVKELIKKLQTMPQDFSIVLEIADSTLPDRLFVYSEEDSTFYFTIEENVVCISAN